MKKVLIALLCLSCIAVTGHAQEAAGSIKTTQPDPDAGKFKFDEETYDFGIIEEGPIAQCDFTFKNVGKKPIVISDAKGTCGCTIPMFSKKPVAPKEKGVIHVSYTTFGRVAASVRMFLLPPMRNKTR